MKLEQLHKAYKRLNLSRLCLALMFAMALALSPAFASGDDDDDDGNGNGNQNGQNFNHQHNYNHCKPKKPDYCPTELCVVDEEVNLGTFFANSTNDLPSNNGDGNVIEFILRGDKRITYTIDLDFENRVDLPQGYAEVTAWYWEKADFWTCGRYGWRHRNRRCGFHCVVLYHHWCGGSKCDNFARFRLTAERLYISRNATPGGLQFEVKLTATANI
jgi:hypothetical protein